MSRKVKVFKEMEKFNILTESGDNSGGNPCEQDIAGQAKVLSAHSDAVPLGTSASHAGEAFYLTTPSESEYKASHKAGIVKGCESNKIIYQKSRNDNRSDFGRDDRDRFLD